MATVYLHIGAPKTATSTLQLILAKNASRLQKSGVLYPSSFRHGDAHHTLVCDLMQETMQEPMPDHWYGSVPRGEAWSLLAQELAAQGGDVQSVIISSELFFGQAKELTPAFEHIVQRLQGHDIRIVVYLRRQDQLYSSFYNQDVKGARRWSQSAYQFYQTHRIFEHGYSSMLQWWADVFGAENIIVRPFESSQWPDGNIVKDFCQATGIKALSGKNVEHNDSLGHMQLYIKRCLNRVGYDPALNEEVITTMRATFPQDTMTPCRYVNAKLYGRYREQWLQDNERISEVFLDGRALFTQPIPDAGELPNYRVDRLNAGLWVFCLHKIFSQGRYPEFRQLFSKAALLLLAELNIWNAVDKESRSTLMDWATNVD